MLDLNGYDIVIELRLVEGEAPSIFVLQVFANITYGLLMAD
jgi:hypothetical protein